MEITVTLFPPGGSEEVPQKAWGLQAQRPVDLAAAHLIPGEVAKELRSIPIERQGPVLTIAMADPDDLAARLRLSEVTGLRVRPVAAPAEVIDQALPAIYSGSPFMEGPRPA